MQVLILAALVSHVLERKIGDHFVGVHVRRRAGAALNYIDHDLFMQLAGADVLARFDDDVLDRLVEQAKLAVDDGGCLFDAGQHADQVRIDRDRAAVIGKYSTARSVCTP